MGQGTVQGPGKTKIYKVPKLDFTLKFTPIPLDVDQNIFQQGDPVQWGKHPSFPNCMYAFIYAVRNNVAYLNVVRYYGLLIFFVC